MGGADSLFKITDLSTLDEVATSTRDSSKTKLFEVLDDPVTKGKTIHEHYDFSDGWQHVIVCTGRSLATQDFVCLDGEGHGAAESVGGWHGWLNLLAAYDARAPTQEQRQLMEWFEKSAWNKDPAGLRGDLRRKWDKDAINKILSRPKILMISLEKQSFFDDMFSATMARLRSAATVVEVTTIASAMDQLKKTEGSSYTAVILSEAGILEKTADNLQKKVVEYAKGGGTVVMGLMFSNFCRMDDMDRFFESRWNLLWKRGSYCRQQFSLNPQVNADFRSRRLPGVMTAYNVKALHLRNVDLRDRVYVSNPVKDDSPAVFAKYGSGYLGWIGDVNGEAESTELLLSMCGLAK